MTLTALLLGICSTIGLDAVGRSRQSSFEVVTVACAAPEIMSTQTSTGHLNMVIYPFFVATSGR